MWEAGRGGGHGHPHSPPATEARVRTLRQGSGGPRWSVSAPFLTCSSPGATMRQQLEDTEAAGTFQKWPVLEDEMEVSKQRQGAGRKQTSPPQKHQGQLLKKMK